MNNTPEQTTANTRGAAVTGKGFVQILEALVRDTTDSSKHGVRTCLQWTYVKMLSRYTRMQWAYVTMLSRYTRTQWAYVTMLSLRARRTGAGRRQLESRRNVPYESA